MLLSVDFPMWLKPEIIPGLPFRWYGLMYILAFATAFLVYRRQVKERRFPMTEEQLYSLFTWGILGLLLGARLFSALVYSGDRYILRPWLIFWPFENGHFTGLMGMSYHGGAIGGLLGVILWARAKRFNFREIGDMYAASIPLGYTFGRLGNFINGELYGRVTTGPLGMVFPHATPLAASEPWVQEAAEKTGAVRSGLVNLPRHPSQLYEMILEGLVLWAIIWFFRNRKPAKGFLIGLYFLGYGFFRFFIEYFREPDADLGYRIQLVKNTLPTALAHPPLSFSTGQILCFGMIVFGIVWMIIVSRLPDHVPVRVYEKSEGKPEKAKTTEEKASERNRRRKQRRKLR
ncbi:MAG: prolipoprotein diacylglyceryl transferase [Treponema sp.]|nr:prolipoprotein diacylglyceryl transferase [Treponema sp.]